MHKVRLLRDCKYSVPWAKGPVYKAGTVVPVIAATNLPLHKERGLMWINTAELRDDPYGMLIDRNDYVEESR